LLALIYVAMTAKPLSLRRLLMLFVVTLVLANAVFGLLHEKHASNAALVAAAAMAFVMWSMPLMVLARHGILYRGLPIGTLDRASGFVRWTYVFALTLVVVLALRELIDASRQITLAELTQLTSIGGLASVALVRGFSALNQCSSRSVPRL